MRADWEMLRTAGGHVNPETYPEVLLSSCIYPSNQHTGFTPGAYVAGSKARPYCRFRQ